MQHIIFRDLQKKVYEPLFHLRDETEALITKNLILVNQSNSNGRYQITDVYDGNLPEATDYWDRQGWTMDQSVYDSMIIEYNQANPDKILTRWV